MLFAAAWSIALCAAGRSFFASAASPAATAAVVSAITGPELSRQADVAVYTLGGILVARGRGVPPTLPRGTYVVKHCTDGQVVRIIVVK